MKEENAKLCLECVKAIQDILKNKDLTVSDVDCILNSIFAFFLANSMRNIQQESHVIYLKDRMLSLSSVLDLAIQEVHNENCEKYKKATDNYYNIPATIH